MKRYFNYTVLIILMHLTCALANAQSTNTDLVIYKAPKGHFLNNDFFIQVRVEGGEWQKLAGYYALNMNKGPYQGSTINVQTFAYFDSDFGKRLEVKVIKARGTFTSARIRPTSYGIDFKQENNNTISFFLDKPRNISVEFDNDIYHNLFLFANEIDVNQPKEGDPSVTYFGPGFHDAGNMTLKSGETIYLAGGSIVRGNIKGSGITNASVRGHGILQNGGIRIDNSSHITIEGIIIVDCPGWTIVPNQVDSSLIRDVKIINKTISSDGSDPSGCRNLTYDNVFFRIPDDCISIKCFRVTKPNLDMVIKNSTFWADAAHCILIGPEGNGTSTERVLISNCDFLECQSPWPEYNGVFGFTNGDNVTIKDITIEDCRVEDFSFSNLVEIRIEMNDWVKAPGGPIKNVIFRNITYKGSSTNTNYLKGFDETRCIDGVIFENLVINGKHILNAEQGNFEIGPHAKNIVFK